MTRILSAALLLAVASLASQQLPAAEHSEATSATAVQSSAAASAPSAPQDGAAPAVPAELPAVTGTWALTVETSAGTGTPTLMLEQAGGTLTGTYKGRFGEHPLTGTLVGNAIRLTFTVSGPMGTGEVTYSGTVADDVMRGTMQIGPGMGGSFVGRRQ